MIIDNHLNVKSCFPRHHLPGKSFVFHFFQCNVDLSFSHDVPVTFKLVEGSGPVCLAGQHLIGRFTIGMLGILFEYFITATVFGSIK